MEENRKEIAVVPHMVQGLYDRVEILEQILLQTGLSNPAVKLQWGMHGKCGSCLTKGELVFLFFILMDEEMLFFHSSNSKKNRRAFQDFIEQNFTYMGEGNRQHIITRVSRNFSECAGFTYNERHLAYLEKIIAVLMSRKERMEAL